MVETFFNMIIECFLLKSYDTLLNWYCNNMTHSLFLGHSLLFIYSFNLSEQIQSGEGGGEWGFT